MKMGWIGALIVLASLTMLALKLKRVRENDEGWREQTEGLRERWERSSSVR